jgi:hypothetical protein
MSPGIIALIVVVIIALAVAGLAFARPQLQRQRLRMRFGEEYDHAVRAHQSRTEAEREMLAREERHRKLNLRPLDPEARERYRAEWTAIQERFVDDPRAAAAEADRLITSIMSDLGYPDEGHDQRLADLSVGRTRAVGHYRRARDVGVLTTADGASTEDLRQALMHYRAVFDDLFDGRPGRLGGGKDDRADRTDDRTGRSDERPGRPGSNGGRHGRRLTGRGRAADPDDTPSEQVGDR